MVACLFFFVALLSIAFGDNNKPLVGILALPCDSEPKYCHNNKTGSYIGSSYVKWLESGGARVIPIPLSMSEPDVYSLIDSLNGVLFTGGAADFTESEPYWRHVNWILDYLRKIATPVSAVPLWATCLGFEALLRYANVM